MNDPAAEELKATELVDLQPEKIDKPQLCGMDPRKSYYVVYSAFWLDGSSDEKEGLEGIFDTEKEAMDRCRELIESYSNMDCWIYVMKPLGRARRGPVKLTRFK